MAQHLAEDHRLLKAIVIGLGVLIVLGFGALIFGLATKGSKPSAANLAVPAAPAPVGPPLVLASDANIADMTMSEHRLVLRVTMAHSEELVLIDLPSGQVVQRIPVKRAD